MGLQRLDMTAFLALIQNLEDLGRALRGLRAYVPIRSARFLSQCNSDPGARASAHLEQE